MSASAGSHPPHPLLLFLLLIATSGISISIPVIPNVCGKQQFRSSKVVGGNDTNVHEFPWTVSIRRLDHHHCGGTIVAARWILTAAHCVGSSRVPSAFVVRIGEFNLQRSDQSEIDYPVDRIVIHENYSGLVKSSLTSINGADIALLRTRENISLDDHAWPVCLPADDRSFSGQEAVVVGWGKRNEKSDVYSPILQKVQIPIIDNKVCESWYKKAGREMVINDKIICAGFRDGGRDACHGDSGGPLLRKIDDQWSVIGVVSTGIGCARPLLPGLYSRVSSYYKWIANFTRDQ